MHTKPKEDQKARIAKLFLNIEIPLTRNFSHVRSLPELFFGICWLAMSQLPSVCCVSLTKWKDYIGREQGDLLGASLGAFVDSECPNRPAIQQSYLTALANLETEVKKIVMILQQLDCSPLQSKRRLIDDKQTF